MASQTFWIFTNYTYSTWCLVLNQRPCHTFLLLQRTFSKTWGLFGFLTSSSISRLYLTDGSQNWCLGQFYVLPYTRQSRETMTSASACHIILTLIQPVGSGWPQRGLNLGPPHQELPALPTELTLPSLKYRINRLSSMNGFAWRTRYLRTTEKPRSIREKLKEIKSSIPLVSYCFPVLSFPLLLNLEFHRLHSCSLPMQWAHHPPHHFQWQTSLVVFCSWQASPLHTLEVIHFSVLTVNCSSESLLVQPCGVLFKVLNLVIDSY